MTSWASAGEVRWTFGQLELPGLERGELEDVADQLEQVLAGVADLLHLLALLGGERTVDLGEQDVGEPEDGVERTAQLVAHRGEEGGAVAIGLGGAVEVDQVALLRRGEAGHQVVEGAGEDADLVEGAQRNPGGHRFEARLVGHLDDALGDELDVANGVARHRRGHRRRHAEEQDGQREERRDEGLRSLRGVARRHEGDERLPAHRRTERARGELGRPGRRRRVSLSERDGLTQGGFVRRLVGHAQEHRTGAVDDEELRVAHVRRLLQERRGDAPPGARGRRAESEAMSRVACSAARSSLVREN